MDDVKKPISVVVKWDTSREIPSDPVYYLGRTYQVVAVDDPADASIHVFDADRWDEPEDSGEGFHHDRLPGLVICDEGREEEWLRITPELSDVCTSEDDVALSYRLVRMAIRNSERTRMAERSFTDTLTKTLPRNELMRRLGLEIFSARQDRPLALLLLDLDRFKDVNDRYGNPAGDTVLRKVAGVLRDAVGGRPDVYRYGGEEFVIVSSMNRTQAVAFGEYIRGQVEELVVDTATYQVKVTVSIGIAVTGGETDREALLEAADKALYEAKSRGRNTVVEVAQYFDQVETEGGDPVIKDFENRIRVLTDRLTEALTYKSKQLVTRYKREAEIDGLTGLYVRRYFDRLLAREFDTARSKDRDLSMIFIDIDHFGNVNKTYGFPTGDRALEEVAALIKEHIRAVDWAARYGGEELVVVLPDTDETQACDIAQRIWTEVGKHQFSAQDGRTFSLTVSAGVAQLKPNDEDLKAFVQRTSDRTRQAKARGRNQMWCSDL